jgi:hypothetical protein
MNDKLLQLFDTYKSSEYYNNSSIEVNLDWLKDKLDSNHFEELEKQFIALLLENEEELFINSFKYAWGIFQELSSKNV